ncbi:SdiA-regulated domain-containing protein [Luteolibacter ambystomatis]|uniref:SdiA-regulated domain-containing protein n=1 Tax=Luteolibacter ambystomatis TaxID=2824561 RepID=A0A975IY19_9BACT|nr:SdiA-regulated domain-containing protein [Luteolibacter ambystomatis]QUE49423.1 SdiA-regulated domain-containing protein [Luteolibacter ambystomatis]
MNAHPSILAAIPALAVAAQAAPLHDFTSARVYALDSICSEASGVAYSRNTDSLYVIGDEGGNFIELSKTGQVKSSMLLHNFNSSADPEGVAYLGNGRFMLALERMRRGYFIDYVPGAEATRINNTGPIFLGDGSVQDNIGLEGICYDPLTDSLWGVKERDPVMAYVMTGYTTNQPVVTMPIKGSKFINAGLSSMSDVYVLANCATFSASDPRRQNILFLGRDDKRIVEMTRTGTVVDTLDIAFLNRGTIEGLTMDDDGVLYLVSEQITAASPGQPSEGLSSRLIVLTPAPLKVMTSDIVRSGSQMTAALTWGSSVGVSYVIEYTPDLSSPWAAVSGVQTAVGAFTSATSAPVTGQKGFFRVRQTTP